MKHIFQQRRHHARLFHVEHEDAAALAVFEGEIDRLRLGFRHEVAERLLDNAGLERGVRRRGFKPRAQHHSHGVSPVVWSEPQRSASLAAPGD
jgi:hypothetical protein